MQHQSQETDQGVRPNAVRQTVINRSDFNLTFQDAESPFNIRQGFVAGHDLLGRQILNAGDEHQFTIHGLSPFERFVVFGEGKTVGFEVDFDKSQHRGILSMTKIIDGDPLNFDHIN